MRTLLIALVCASLAFAADVTGKWQFQVETEMGSGSPTFVLEQKGEKVTGVYTGQLGEAKVTGAVRGDTVELSFEVSPTGEAIVVRYSGTLDGADRIKGTIDFGGLGKGKFTAERAK